MRRDYWKVTAPFCDSLVGILQVVGRQFSRRRRLRRAGKIVEKFWKRQIEEEGRFNSIFVTTLRGGFRDILSQTEIHPIGYPSVSFLLLIFLIFLIFLLSFANRYTLPQRNVSSEGMQRKESVRKSSYQSVIRIQ